MNEETPLENTGYNVEILDTTLRDGEQTEGVAIAAEEKLTLARTLLNSVQVDRVEVASARVSEGEKQAVSQIADWAQKQGIRHKVEVLGFCDKNRSADWVGEAGGRVINLLAKGSLKHVEGQLQKRPEEHVEDIRRTVEYCADYGISCNCYPEDWSHGVQEEGTDYARWLIRELVQMPIQRIMLPDTLGIFSPEHVRRFVGEVCEAHPQTHFDFHAHNDYGLATANSLAALRAGARGVHVTVNGLGERAGNAALDEVAVASRDLVGVVHRINEEQLVDCSKMVEVFSGRRLASNKPISGEAVFTQTAGIHADGDHKGDLYVTRLRAERFKRKRSYALGKLSGKASLDMNLQNLGLQLTEEQKKLVLQRVIELGDQKHTITEDDLPFIINDVLQSPADRVLTIEDCVVTTTKHIAPTATIKVRYGDEIYQASDTGDGGYDAFMRALHRIIVDKLSLSLPGLADYEVTIPPGGETDALVHAKIAWDNGMRSEGVDSDQLRAAVIATEHMLNNVLSSDTNENQNQ